jgi:hypothetical protein
MIEVRLVSFYVDGKNLHLTLEFPDQVVVKNEQKAVASPEKLGRQDILRCRTLTEVLFRLKNEPETCAVVQRYQREENANGRRATPRKVAELLFPTKTSKVKVYKNEEKAVIPVANRSAKEITELYQMFEDQGINDVAFRSLADPVLVGKFGNIAYLCSQGSMTEIQSAISQCSDNSKRDSI